MLDYPEEVSFRTGAEAAKSFDDIVNIVKDAEVDVLINYAPVGSEKLSKQKEIFNFPFLSDCMPQHQLGACKMLYS